MAQHGIDAGEELSRILTEQMNQQRSNPQTKYFPSFAHSVRKVKLNDNDVRAICIEREDSPFNWTIIECWEIFDEERDVELAKSRCEELRHSVRGMREGSKFGF